MIDDRKYVIPDIRYHNGKWLHMNAIPFIVEDIIKSVLHDEIECEIWKL